MASLPLTFASAELPSPPPTVMMSYVSEIIFVLLWCYSMIVGRRNGGMLTLV